jgi:MerR family transcriptional regulator, light-induced transcriptional regulator
MDGLIFKAEVSPGDRRHGPPPIEWANPSPGATRPPSRTCCAPILDPVTEDGLQAVLLAKAVEYEIIPRLMLAHRVPKNVRASPIATSRSASPPKTWRCSPNSCCTRKTDAVRDCVITLRDRGVPVESHLPGPAGAGGPAPGRDVGARPVHLHRGHRGPGSAAEGVARKQRGLRPVRQSASRRARPGASCSCPAPGEQHTFGLSLVAELFHRAGWDVVTCFLATDAAAVMVKKDWYDVVGFSLGSETGVPRLRAGHGAGAPGQPEYPRLYNRRRSDVSVATRSLGNKCKPTPSSPTVRWHPASRKTGGRQPIAPLS